MRSSRGGDFLLRLEDTDQTRLVEGAGEHLQSMLEWAGMPPDEGPAVGGPVGPYVQSQRLPLYQQHAEQLLASGHAYYCFCSSERLSALRDASAKKGVPSLYDRLCANLSAAEVQKRLSDPSGPRPVVRMRVPEGVTSFRDEIRGTIRVTNIGVDDQVLLKSDGFPTYHLAAVVDDYTMAISHVIRGEEWLPSTAKHVVLYRAFGWPEPLFYHLPLLLDSQKHKLSKRKGGNVNVEDFGKAGFLPEAIINFVALLGWNPGSAALESEALSLDDLVECFDLNKVRKSGAVVAEHKLEHINQLHIRKMAMTSPEELRRRVTLGAAAQGFDDAYVIRVLQAVADSVTTLHDFTERSECFFKDPVLRMTLPDGQPCPVRSKLWKDDAAAKMIVQTTLDELGSLDEPACSDENAIAAMLTRVGDMTGKGKGIFGPLRYALTGQTKGPGVAPIIATIGRQACMRRLTHAATLAAANA